MKDKEMIEEMAKEIAKRDCYLFDNCPKLSKHACISQNPTIMMESTKNYISIATWLVKAGYRKIPKNAFILTDDNAEELANLIITSPQMQSAMIDLIKVWKKETAEKILNELYCTPKEQVENKIKELARFIGVEIKE